jgi:tetratricopeptide (TPR) repeat protein
MKNYLAITRNCSAFVLMLGLSFHSFAQTKAAQNRVTQNKKDTVVSISEIETAINRNPGNPKLYVELGLAYWDKNDSQHAFVAFQEAVKVGPTSAEAHNWLGVALMEKSDVPGAIAELRKAVSLNPKYSRAYANLGSALSTSGDLAEAVKVFKQALTLDPNSLAAHLNLGIALRQQGDAEGALVHLRRVARAEPNNFHYQYELGQTLRQSGDLAGAVAAFENALRINPELQEGYYGLGLALKQQSAAARKPPALNASAADEIYKTAQEAAAKGDLNAAKEQLSEAIRADEGHAASHNLLGYILGQQGDLASALPHLERAIALDPAFSDAHYNYGVALWLSGSKAKSLSELRESVRLDPASGATYAFLGMAQRESGDLAGARVSLQRAIALLPATAATYIDLGVVFLRQGELDKALGQLEAGLNVASPSVPTPDWDAAISGLRDLLKKAPDRADAHNMVGLLLGRKGADSSEVLAELREAVRLRPDYAQAHNNIGLVLAQGDNDEKAMAEFREAIRVSPDYADAHANLGATLMPTDADQAITELQKAVLLNPASVKAQFNLAEAYGNSPNFGPSKQMEQLRKVISISPNFARAHLALGKALLHDGKAADAINELREATRLDPQSGESHYQLGLALARAGQQEEATAEVQKGRELSAADERNQNANLDIAEGRTALANGELEQAAAKFQHAIKLQPESSTAQHLLATVLEKQGDSAGAAAAYRKALDLNPGDLSAKQAIDRLSLPDSPTAATTSNPEQDDSTRITELEDYIRKGRFKEVEPLLTDYLQQHPESFWGWYALGYSQFAQKKIGASIQSLSKSLQLNIKNAEAHKILGRDLMIIGKFEAAQIEFEQGIRYDPKSAELHYDLGKLFSMQDNWQDARAQFAEALRIDPSYLEALDALGLTQEALGDDAGAVSSYQKAMALNEERHGNFVAAHVNLSAYYNRTGDSVKALQLALKALDLDPNSDKAWFQKGRAEEHEGHLQEAADSLNRAISLNQRASSYYYVLAGVYRRLGKTGDSQKALESFTRLDRENNELEKMRRSMSKPAGAPPPGGERE